MIIFLPQYLQSTVNREPILIASAGSLTGLLAQAQDFTNLTKDDILGDLFYATALTYYAVLDTMDYVQAKKMGVIAIRLPSEAHFSYELSVYSIFGIPLSVSAGGLALDLGRISQEQMEALKTKLETTKAKLEAEDFTGMTKDDILGDLLYTTALSFYALLDVMDYVQAKTMNVLAIRLPSEAHFSTELSVYSVFGVPMSVSSGGLAMDVDRQYSMVKAFDGDTEKPKQFFLSSGMNGSALEHSVPEQLFSTPEEPAYGISAVKALKIANDEGIPIYTIDQSNINTILPNLQLDAGTITDIKNAVNAGKTVTAPQTDITYNGWTGHGYIVIDPDTGAGAYMISGGLSGGILLLGIFLFILAVIFTILAIACVALTGPAALLCVGLFAMHAIATILGGIATMYGKATLDEFMDCLTQVLGFVIVKESFLTAAASIITGILKNIFKVAFAGWVGWDVGRCIEKTFYNWEEIYN